MARFLDYDPLRAVAQYEDRTQGGNMQLHTRQDVEPILDYAAAHRSEGASDRFGRRTDMYLYASIPPVVILKLKYEYGVDIFKSDHVKRAIDIINRDFPKLKCTDKVHRLAQ